MSTGVSRWEEFRWWQRWRWQRWWWQWRRWCWWWWPPPGAETGGGEEAPGGAGWDGTNQDQVKILLIKSTTPSLGAQVRFFVSLLIYSLFRNLEDLIRQLEHRYFKKRVFASVHLYLAHVFYILHWNLKLPYNHELLLKAILTSFNVYIHLWLHFDWDYFSPRLQYLTEMLQGKK